jgi:hypothetical protein
MTTPVDLATVKAIAAALIDEHLARTGRAPPNLVALGGSAMAIHGMRATSTDADFYLTDLDDDAVDAVVKRFRPSLGDDFRLDVTPVNSTWGKIALLDIEESPATVEIDTTAGPYVLRALRPEDLFLLKASAGRAKDLDDLPAIAAHTSIEALTARAKVVIPWYGDRAALPDFLLRFATEVAHIFAISPTDVEDRLKLSATTRQKIAAGRARAERRASLLARAAAKPPGQST